MKLGETNQLQGTILNVVRGAVQTKIQLKLQSGERLITMVTNQEAEALSLQKGAAVTVIIPASQICLVQGEPL